jgi:AcrR family transcriptional regulator
MDRTATTKANRRRRRDDGERTHAAILEAATRLASVEGLHGLTIGRLAESLGVSKSGLYAHFGSKEQLQLETIEAAQRIYEQEVSARALAAPEGLGRLKALCEAYFSYVERRVFPGGCFFASLLAEMDARSGPIHDVVESLYRAGSDNIVETVHDAQRLGELDRDVDAEQVAFELQACLDWTNYQFVLFDDPEVLGRGRRSVESVLERARAPKRRPARRAKSPE